MNKTRARSPIDRGVRAEKRNARLQQKPSQIANRSYEKVSARIAAKLNTAFGVIAFLTQLYDFLNQDVPTIIRETLRSIGLDWRDDDPLTKAGLSQVVSRMTGIHFTDVLDPMAVRADVIAEIGSRIEAATGYRPTSFEPTELRDGFVEHFKAQIRVGGASGPAAAIARQCQHVAWDAKRLGYEWGQDGWDVHLRRWNWRQGSKNYAVEHKQQWKLRALWKREWNDRLQKFGPWKHIASKKDVWYWWKRNQIRYHYAIEEGMPWKALLHKNYVPPVYPPTTQYAPTDKRLGMPDVPGRRRSNGN